MAGYNRSVFGMLEFRAIAISAQSYKTFAGIFVLGMIGMHVFFFWNVRGRIERGDPDFTVYYTAGTILREGRGAQLYDPKTQFEVQQRFTSDPEIRKGPLPYIHPPFEALIFVPLTWLPYTQAFAVWTAANLVVLYEILVLLRRSVPSLQRFRVVELYAAGLAFFPVFANFYQGQDAFLLLLVLVLAFRALEKGSELESGCWLGLGTFKYHFIIPLLVILVLWRGRRVIAGFLGSAVAVVALSVALVGWSEARQYPLYAWHVISRPGFGRIPFEKLPNLLGLVGGWPGIEEAGWVRWTAAVLSVAILIVVAGLRPARNQGTVFRLSFCCAVIAALLVGYSTNSYDLSWLVLPLAIVAGECLQKDRACRMSLIIPAIPLLVSPLWFLLAMKWERLNVIAVLLLWWVFAIRQQVLRLRSKAEENTSVSLLA
jgi:Glycosyltransferase family 87